ncbi:hypothetical protein [Nocardia wallacei]|uniref:hypothetical protein n=1 Tax=Nocardia wallacei TaxID=480035 RepID=UPI0024588794|nr:hypothetical protein [Nocardia wallacei]
MRAVTKTWQRITELAESALRRDHRPGTRRHLRLISASDRDSGAEHSSVTTDRPRGEPESSPRGLGGMDF